MGTIDATTAHTTDTEPTPRGQTFQLGSPWQTVDPFLFAAYHDDAYPAGNDELGPAVDVSDRPLGRDFGNPAGWNMYHGQKVPGFPAHPHRGFETITIVRRGVIDHADSTGASARYSDGDVQWVTAGGGVNHSEMFPLLDPDGDNPLELFQLWLNLPARTELSPAEFKMFWNEDVPVVVTDDGRARVKVVAGTYGDVTPPAPPANSWASDPGSHVAVWLVELDADATVTLPGTGSPDARRVLYVHGGDAHVTVDGTDVDDGWGYAQLDDGATTIVTGERAARVLVMQGVPLDEPVAQYGPFVLSSEDALEDAFAEYRRTGFGGWRWADDAPVHARDRGRFAEYGDGRVEEPSLRP